MSTILHLNLGERLLIANVSADVKGASSVIRTVRRVRHAISARELLDRKVSLSEIGDVDGDLIECDFPPDAFEWLVKTYNDKQDWQGVMADWVASLGDKLEAERIAGAVSKS